MLSLNEKYHDILAVFILAVMYTISAFYAKNYSIL